MKKSILFILLVFCWNFSIAQVLRGTVRDDATGETIIGAGVLIKGTTIGTLTDLDGKFELDCSGKMPVTIEVKYVGYSTVELTAKDAATALIIRLKAKAQTMKTVEVTGSRISEKQKEAPLTVESMDIIAIKEAPQQSFYQALGSLKGVDMTTASLGFTVINTRGFNSTSPVRSLQIIDGVDNQSPGLNFSLGNFLGASELDVLKVDLVAGASSAYYGPNAFNGVISMYSRSPFVKPGLEVSAKSGERGLLEGSIRWSQVIKNKAGKEKLGYKINAFYMRANDWVADNMAATEQSKSGSSNPGGYDAVNRYGDEYSTMSDATATPYRSPGLGIYYRTGYHEKDIVDYGTKNLKLNAAVHYKLGSTELIFSSNYGSGTTVYQGDNRYSLRNISFYQNRVEWRKDDKFFLRVYATTENSGDSYDAFLTALLLQRAAKDDQSWAQDYSNHWNTTYSSSIRGLAGFPLPSQYPVYTDYLNAINPFLYDQYGSLMQRDHDETRGYADTRVSATGQFPRFEPGTPAFDSAFKAITTTIYDYKSSNPGSGLYDRSSLYHAHGEYRFKPSFAEVVVGANSRLYRPDSKGTIFRDTGDVIIRNLEVGVYAGVEKKVAADKLKLNLTARLDKNRNFDYLVSPALSAVYTFNPRQILRAAVSSAIRNPTLADQYLFYHVGRAVLVGNLNGFDSLVTINSMLNAFNTQNPDTLEYFNVAPIRPEQVKTLELGYRATLWNKLFLDMVAYYSWYKHFIGYKIGADVSYEQASGLFYLHDIYRVAANSEDVVTTRGVSIGMNYFIGKFYSVNGNYSYNLLDRGGSTDPLIPAYNTPENKFNIGFSARDLDVRVFNKLHIRNSGFTVNYKWVQGFRYEGSPQFTGYVPTYGMLDAQFNYKQPKLHTTFKLGASNLLDNRRFTVYGGPAVGRLAYFSVLVELQK